MSLAVFELFRRESFRLEDGGIGDEDLVFLVFYHSHSWEGVQVCEFFVSELVERDEVVSRLAWVFRSMTTTLQFRGKSVDRDWAPV